MRVNSAGTPLEGEELRYSILKSAFPEVQTIVERLATRLMSPAQFVTLISRIVLARIERDKDEPPREPDVGRFRRLVDDHNPIGFRGMICCYLGIQEAGCEASRTAIFGRARNLLAAARELLVNGAWGMPPVLVADLARNSGAEEAFSPISVA